MQRRTGRRAVKAMYKTRRVWYCMLWKYVCAGEGKAMEPQATKRQKGMSLAALVLVTVIWGWGFVFSQMALNAGISSAGVMFGRFALGLAIVAVFFGRQLRRYYKPGQWRGGLISGLFLFLAFYFQLLGMERSTPANAAFITGSYVVMVPFLMWITVRRRPGPIIFVASFLALAGVGILSYVPGAGLAFNFGDFLTLLCALFFACQIVATGLFARTTHHIPLVFMQLLVAAVLSCVVFLAVDRDFSGFMRWDGMLSIGYLGVFSTFVCYFLQTWAQRYISSGKVAILLASESLLGPLFSIMVGYDVFSLRMVVGGLVLFAAIILPDLWPKKKDKPLP